MGESGTAGHQQEQKPVALEQLTCEPQIGSSMPDASESMDCNLGTQLTVQQEIQIANGASPSLVSDMSYLQDKVPKGQQRKPSGERPFSCGQCGKCYHRSTDLAKHERAHTAKKTYMCNICGKNFHRNMALLIHARIHTGERPYQCTQCGKRFVQSQHLTTHQRTHTGEKPFQCKECGKGFQCRSEFILHQKNHTEKGSVTFDDVAVRFSEEEWKDLEKHKKELYRDVMMENYQTLISLGFVTHKPEIVLKIERGEDPIASTSRGYVFPHNKSSECFLLNEIPNEQTPRMVNLGQPDRSLRKSLMSPVTSGQKVLQSKAGQEVGTHDNKGRSASSISPGETLRKRACKDKASAKQTLPVGCHQDRTYSCNVCSKTFVRKQYLKIHSRTHTEERPFTCGQCGSMLPAECRTHYPPLEPHWPQTLPLLKLHKDI